ncbi:MAG: 16S rRNA (cytosine(1402)-N(4))-methyltransferase RsmH [Deltaproteobacteria bacterium]|nr:16S rRNA (cytosine(1402)-N(4))-methyltransferase RsmH [Deltaproteobacteria bacterium]
MSDYQHITVLLEEAVAALAPADGKVYVDCTLGGGGHAEALLSAADCRVIGLDRDMQAISAAGARLARFGDRFQAVHAPFSDLTGVLGRLGLAGVDGVLADLGVSSPQLDQPERGFSFRGHLIDMRMDPSQPLSALEVVNAWPEEELSSILYRYGEEPRARRIAKVIVAGRPWEDATALADAVGRATGRKPGHTHLATRSFQAIRMAVNDELGELERLLPAALMALNPCGRLAVISFHSLEDRLVKQFVSRESGRGAARDPWGNPMTPVRLASLPRTRPRPDDSNSRARSAHLRAAVRLPCPTP